jgi:hypothetical protein
MRLTLQATIYPRHPKVSFTFTIPNPTYSSLQPSPSSILIDREFTFKQINTYRRPVTVTSYSTQTPSHGVTLAMRSLLCAVGWVIAIVALFTQ